MDKNKREGADRRMGNARRTDDETGVNSPELQKKFPHIYKKFFNSHDIVLSANTVFTWGAEISDEVSTVKIKQKLPKKIFCGVNMNNSGKVSFGYISHYFLTQDCFKESDFLVFFKTEAHKIIDFLEDFLRKNGSSQGFEIDFLAEVPRGHSVGLAGVISVLLGLLDYLIIGRVDPKTLSKREMSIDQPIFEDVYRHSLDLAQHISHGDKMESSIYTVMIPDTPLPTVCFSEKRSSHDRISSDDCEESILDDSLHQDRTIYNTTLLNFLGFNKESTISEIPMDYGLIYTGLEYVFTDTESTHEGVEKNHKKLEMFLQDRVRVLDMDHRKSQLLSQILNFNKEDSLQQDIDSSNIKILESFHSIFENQYDNTVMNNFINNIKKIGMQNLFHQTENKIFLAIQYLFYQYRQFEDEELGLLPCNTGSIGPSIFIVMKHRKSRETIQKVLDHLKNNGTMTSLEYASWRDGSAHDGIRIEQYISKKLYSEYTQEGNVQFCDSSGMSYFANYDGVIEKEKDSILLDTIAGRIYIHGTKLTSKQIHSQNTTIDMLKILLENIGTEISNSRLPVSTYSQNKNEILGKVVIPIKKLAKEYFGQEISLVCSGGISDYYLKLEHSDAVRIGIIKKLGT